MFSVSGRPPPPHTHTHTPVPFPRRSLAPQTLPPGGRGEAGPGPFPPRGSPSAALPVPHPPLWAARGTSEPGELALPEAAQAAAVTVLATGWAGGLEGSEREQLPPRRPGHTAGLAIRRETGRETLTETPSAALPPASRAFPPAALRAGTATGPARHGTARPRLTPHASRLPPRLPLPWPGAVRPWTEARRGRPGPVRSSERSRGQRSRLFPGFLTGSRAPKRGNRFPPPPHPEPTEPSRAGAAQSFVKRKAVGFGSGVTGAPLLASPPAEARC